VHSNDRQKRKKKRTANRAVISKAEQRERRKNAYLLRGEQTEEVREVEMPAKSCANSGTDAIHIKQPN